MAERYTVEFAMTSERPRTEGEIDAFAREVMDVMQRHRFMLWLEPGQNECLRIRRKQHIGYQ